MPEDGPFAFGTPPTPALELWGGHECTVNRAGDAWHDQTVASGHQHRLSDLARFAELGIASLRYPVLWERVAPERPDERDWFWSDERLAEIRRLGMKPIVGLIHHGSGPRYTSLVDAGFAAGLAEHARATAERYPWVCDWTPVNEPLTTARFAALYGHWYPHARDDRAFWTALLNQIDGVRLSMRAVRAVNPDARLVQTEDLGFTHATPKLAWQAEYENLRRWATWDLLTGAVTPDHRLWGEIAGFGLADRLRVIADDPCPPDVVGVNHYLTSERLLDHRLRLYPRAMHGPRGWVDVEAVRGLGGDPLGWAGVLRQAWERYGLPIAVTEAHNGCTRDEQMRWFIEAWDAAEQVRAEGADIRAVTAWALLGSHDWCSLLTRREGRYEVGVYDLRPGEPRPTAMVPLLKALSQGERPDSPVLDGQGWWRRPQRRLHPPVGRVRDPAPRSRPRRPILLAGEDTPLGKVAAGVCAHRDLAVAKIGDDAGEAPAWASLQVAGDRLTAWRLAGGRRLGASLHAAFSLEHRDSPVLLAAEALRRGQPVHAAETPVRPMFAPDAVDAVLDLLIDGAAGEWRLEVEEISERDLFVDLARRLGADEALVRTVRSGDGRRFDWPVATDFSVPEQRVVPLPPLGTALHRLVERLRGSPAAAPHCDLHGDAVVEDALTAD